MTFTSRIRLAACAFAITAAAGLAQTPKPAAPKSATVAISSTLATEGSNIRQYAFDGDPATAFVSAGNAVKGDTVTLTFDPPVSLKKIAVATGKAKAADAVDAGALECSADGEKFDSLAPFANGSAAAEPGGKKVKAIRIRVDKDLGHPLAVSEFTIDCDPPVAAYKYPIEFTVVSTDDPSLKEWAEKVARVCETEYPKINEVLKSDGFKPKTQVTMTLRSNYRGVAATGGARITGSVKYFKDHPADVGAMVHETVHVVQNYRGRGNPGWLVEGIADYYRFFLYEPGKIGRLNVNTARYNGSYRVSARFLDYLTQKYDKEIVRKLNAAMRKGAYKEDLWETYTKKKLADLGAEWKESLTKK
ncbi:MAG TPA: basic secretory protein-like protein [Fimbriiglobus sp.]|jgi:hypothetical protein